MTTVLPVGQPTAELAELATSVAQYLGAADSSRLSDADLVVELRALEVLRRQLQAADIPLVTEIDRRNLGAKHGARSTKGLLQDALRLSPRDARDRADCAQLLGSRVTLTGQTLPPLLPRTAAAHAGGLISADHVRAVLATVADLPAQLPPTELDQVDRILTKIAVQCKPRDVTTAGIRILETLDATGNGPSEADRQRTRHLMLHRRRDGSYELYGRLTPECGAETEAVLNAMAAPRPIVMDESGQELPDERTAAQRVHDALHDVMGLALRVDTLAITGRRAQLIITATSVTDPPLDDSVSDPAAPARSAATSGGAPDDGSRSGASHGQASDKDCQHAPRCGCATPPWSPP